jgi:DNA-binding transcriptional MerR regulator
MLPQIAEMALAEYSTLKAWERRGLIVPSLRATKGSGRPGLYNERDVRVAATLVQLRDRGLDMDALKAVADVLRDFDLAACPVCDGEIILSRPQGTGDSDG